MDFTLRCNSLKCRRQLSDRAIVTTCSHVFCEACSSAALSRPGHINGNGTSVRRCPACDSELPHPDDAIVALLNPGEEWKTSVLAGLNPVAVMECAGRALGFWSYQAVQEIMYQEFLSRSLTDKYSALSSQMDKVIVDANTEISGLREKLTAMHQHQEQLMEKNRELEAVLRQKRKKQELLERQYKQAKSQMLVGGIEQAAEHEAEDAIRGAGPAPSVNSGHQAHGRTGSIGSGRRVAGGRSHLATEGWEKQIPGVRTGIQASARSVPIPTTSSNFYPRSHVPFYGNDGDPKTTTAGRSTLGVSGGYSHPTPLRQPLSALDPSAYGAGHNGGVGVSAGIGAAKPMNDGLFSRAGYSARGLGGVRETR